MIAAIIPKTDHWWQQLAFNWFDIALVLVLAFGFWRGRKRGMTKELIPTLQWVAILFAAGFGYLLLGDWLQHQGYIKDVFGNHFNERTASMMTAYIAIALVVFIVFVAIGRKVNPKLEGSSVFGSNEYYWGVVAGVLRYSCILLVALALLNAPYYSSAEIAQTKAYNNRWYGGGLKDYQGDFIPSVDELQAGVFQQSLLGPLIKDHLSPLLINSTGSKNMAGGGKPAGKTPLITIQR